MATPKTLRPIPKEDAQRLIARHVKDGTGRWEGERYASDFVYKYGSKVGSYKLLRPPTGPWGGWETGKVSL